MSRVDKAGVGETGIGEMGKTLVWYCQFDVSPVNYLNDSGSMKNGSRQKRAKS